MKQESFSAEASKERGTSREGGDIHTLVDGFVKKNRRLLEKLQGVQNALLARKEMDKTERDTRVAQLEAHIQGIGAQNMALEHLERRFEAIKEDFKNFHRAAEELLEEI